MPFVYQILGYPRQKCIKLDFSPVPFSKEEEVRDKYIPTGWATGQGRGGGIHSCHSKAARSHPGEVLSAKLSPWLSTFWAGFRPWDEHLPSVFSRSSPTVRLWDFEAIGIFNCTKKSQIIAPYAWRCKSSRKFCSAKIDLESLNIRIGGSWPVSE